MQTFRINKRRKLEQCPMGDPALEGKLFSKECYLVLITTPLYDSGSGGGGGGGGRTAELRWSINTWTGSDCNMVMSGFIGSMAEKLNNLLAANSNPRNISITHNECGSETPGLAKALGGSIQHMDGESPSSGGTWGSGSTNKKVRQVRLLSMEDGLMVRVAAHPASLKTSRSFVLDADGEVFSWVGGAASRIERAVVSVGKINYE